MEHRDGQGERPSLQRLSMTRGCFSKMRQLGCGHPREDLEFFKGCLDQNRDQLSLECSLFFNRLYQKKN